MRKRRDLRAARCGRSGGDGAFGGRRDPRQSGEGGTKGKGLRAGARRAEAMANGKGRRRQTVQEEGHERQLKREGITSLDDGGETLAERS